MKLTLLLKFNDIWAFDTYPGPHDAGPFFFFFAVANPIYVSNSHTKNDKWVWSEYTTITNCRQTRVTARKSHTTVTRHQENNLSKATISSNGLGGDSITVGRTKFIFWPHKHPQCPPLGHGPGDRIKILSDMFCIFYLWEHRQSLV